MRGDATCIRLGHIPGTELTAEQYQEVLDARRDARRLCEPTTVDVSEPEGLLRVTDGEWDALEESVISLRGMKSRLLALEGVDVDVNSIMDTIDDLEDLLNMAWTTMLYDDGQIGPDDVEDALANYHDERGKNHWVVGQVESESQEDIPVRPAKPAFIAINPQLQEV
jgi:hypothetical protein